MGYDNLRIEAKTNAKAVLKANFIVCFTMTVLIALPTGLLDGIVNYSSLMTEVFENQAIYLGTMVLLILVVPIISLFLFAPINFGIVRSFEKMTKGEKTKIGDIFYYFQKGETLKWCYKLAWRVFLQTIWISIKYMGIPFTIVMGCSAYIVYQDAVGLVEYIPNSILSIMIFAFLVLIPLAVITSIRQYALTLSSYNCIFEESLDIKRTIRQVMEVYKFKKMDLFTFNFSFLGLHILAIFLSVFSLGIPFVLFTMYKTMATVLYAKYNYTQPNTIEF